MEAVLIGLAAVAMLGGTFCYNPIRRKMAGIIGVGGAYVIVLGIMLLAGSIGTLINGNSAGTSTGEMVMMIVVMVVCLGYMVLVMITRCHTVSQRIWLPIAACLIGFGFCWRLLAAVVLHIPMESGKKEETKFPKILYDNNENIYQLLNDSGDHADYYCQKTGETKQFWESDLADGLPFGWRRG